MAVNSGGMVVTVGMGCEHARLPVISMTVREITMAGSFRYANTVRGCLLALVACCPGLSVVGSVLHVPEVGDCERALQQHDRRASTAESGILDVLCKAAPVRCCEISSNHLLALGSRAGGQQMLALCSS